MFVPNEYKPSRKEKIIIYGIVFVIMTIVGAVVVLGILDSYYNHSIEGVVSQIEQEKFVVTQSDWNLTKHYPAWEQIDAPKVEINSLKDFISQAKLDSYYSVSFDEYRINAPGIYYMIFWEPHYADTNPFYDIWYYDGEFIFIYVFNPRQGTG